MYDFLKRQSCGGLFLMFAAIATALYLPLILWNAWPENDVAVRYAPMAEAFARGDFMYAFHPRCQMLHSTVAGIIAWMLGTNGFTACKLSALLFYILGSLPVMGIAKSVFGRDRVVPTLALYLLCYQVVALLVVGGVRDSAKMFTLLCAAYYAIRLRTDRDDVLNYLLFGACCGLGVCVRGEMLLISIFLLLGMLILDGARHWICWRSVCAATAAMAVGTVELLINWRISGYAIPSHHLGQMFVDVFECIPTPGIVYGGFCLPGLALLMPVGALCHLVLKCKKLKAALPWICLAAGIISYLPPLFFLDEGMEWRDYAERVCRGLSPVFFITACVGMAVERKRGTWTGEKTVLAMMFALCEFLMLDQITYYDRRLFTSTRYLLAAVPLVLPWSAVGIEWMLKLLAKHCPFLAWKYAVTALVICGALLSLYGTYRQELNCRWRPKECRRWAAIQALTKELKKEPKSRRDPGFSLDFYQSNMGPHVFLSDEVEHRLSAAAYLAGCSIVQSAGNADIVISIDREYTDEFSRDRMFRDSKGNAATIWKRNGMRRN